MAVDINKVLATCTLTRWSHRAGRCNWCDRMLVGRQRRWCSELCSRNFNRDHDWNHAREAAKRRDGFRCVRCSSGPHEVEDAFAQALKFLGVDPLGSIDMYRQTSWYKRLVLDRSLEVNHIVPRWGRGYGFGCHNHTANLSTLCHRCHVETTKAQRAFGGIALLPPLDQGRL